MNDISFTGEEDELLNIVEENDPSSPTSKDPHYATVQKKPDKEKSKKNKSSPQHAPHIAERSASFSVEHDSTSGLTSQAPTKDSSPGAVGPTPRRHSEATTRPSRSESSKFATLPPKFKEARNSRIRRVIRKELEAAFSDYANPQDVVGASGADQESEILMAGVGVQTMTRFVCSVLSNVDYQFSLCLVLQTM